MEGGIERVHKVEVNEIPHGAVVGVSIFRTGPSGKKEVLLIKGATDKWHFPGGSMREGETFEECIRRELKEETGITYTGSFGFYSMGSYMVNGEPKMIANVMALDELDEDAKLQEDDKAQDMIWTSDPLNLDLTEQAFVTLSNQMDNTMISHHSE